MDLSGLTSITTSSGLITWLEENCLSPIRPVMSGTDIGVILSKAITLLESEEGSINTIRSGSADPGSGTGVDGDFYINKTSHTVFGPKAAGAWPAGVSMIGPTGATGAAGATGATGATGAAGPGVPVAGTTAQVLAKNSNADYDTHWVTPTGGGVTGLNPKRILYGKSDGTIEQESTDAFNYDSTTHTLYNDAITSENLTGDSIVFVGDSVFFGSYSGSMPGTNNTLTDNTKRMTTLIATRMGLTEVNFAAGGKRIADMPSQTPTKTSAMRFLIVEFGVNDLLSGGVGYTNVNFQTDYTAGLADAISKGWSYSQMILVSIIGTYIAPATLSKTLSFNTVIQNLATANGATYCDAWTPIQTALGGAAYLSQDTTHPNTVGHYVVSLIIQDSMPLTYNITNQAIVLKRTAEFSKLKYRGNTPIEGRIMGVDWQGNIGVTQTLPDNIRTLGTLILGGLINQKGALYPPTGYTFSTVIDTIMAIDATLHALANAAGTVRTKITWIDSTNAAAIFRNNGNGTASGFEFWTGNGAGGEQEVIKFYPNSVIPGGGAYIFNELRLANQAKINSIIGPASAGYIPFDINYYSAFYNTYINGGLSWTTAPTTNGTGVQQGFMFPSGRLLFQNGGTFTQIPCSRHTVNSTTEGILIPRMTSTQRDAMGFITSLGIANGGTGYTTATLAFSGGGGTGAAATATLSGGVITAVTITNGGTGYTTAPTVTVTGDGASASIIVNKLNLVEGLEIYNLTTHTKNYFNGSSWRQITDSAA